MEDFIWKDHIKKEVETSLLKNLGIFTIKVFTVAAVGASVWFYKFRSWRVVIEIKNIHIDSDLPVLNYR